MIVVATDNFELYHDLIRELRRRDFTFTTIAPGDPVPDQASAVIVGPNDAVEVPPELPTVVVDGGDVRAAVQAVAAGDRHGEDPRVIGVDPGAHPGIAVLEGDQVVSVFQVPMEEAVAIIAAERGGHPETIVRIGDGSRLQSARLVNALDDAVVEVVDETGSTPHLGAGAMGVGDIVAAINIARRRGERVNRRELEPSEGELTAIKQRSRERAPDDRSIDTALARQVAVGELTLEEALARHRED